MSDSDLAAVIDCFPSDVSAEVLDEGIQRDGDTATLTVSWRVTGDAAAAIDTNVERTWTFQKVSTNDSSGYKITGLPQNCPFQPADKNGTQEPAIKTPSP